MPNYLSKMYDESYTFLLSKNTEFHLLANEAYLKSLQRPLDIERALEFPADFAILWKKTKCNKLYFHSPKQIGFCCSGIKPFGLEEMPKYKKIYTNCPLCEINTSVYHTHGKTDDGIIITLVRGGYEYNEADKLATLIEKDMLHKCLKDVFTEDVVQNIMNIIKKSSKYPCATIYKLINDLHDKRRKELAEKYKKAKEDYKNLIKYNIFNIKNEIKEELVNLNKIDRITKVPKYYIYDLLYKWYNSLDEKYNKKYIWDISEKWQLYSNEFYQQVNIPQIPESHYMLYKSPKKIKLSSDYPNHKGNLYLSNINKYKKVQNLIIINKKRLAFILNKKITNIITRIVFKYLEEFEFLI